MALAVAYMRTLNDPPTRSLLRKLSVCLILVVVSSGLLAKTETLHYLQYGKYLYLLSGTVLWFTLLLGPETKELWRKAKSNPRAGSIPMLVSFMLIAALTVCAMDIIIHFSLPTRKFALSTSALVVNAILLSSTYLFVFGFTSRVLVAILLVSPIYIVLGIATIAKITHMHAAVQLRDLLYLPELLPQLRDTFGLASIFGVAFPCIALAAAGMALCRKKPLVRVSSLRRSVAVVAGVTVFTLIATSQASDFGHRYSKKIGIRIVHGDSKGSAELNGFLLEFAIHLPEELSVPTPSNYSAQEVAQTAAKYAKQSSSSGTEPERVNLIVYLIESFMDPRDLGFPFTSDPIPTVRALSGTHPSGYAIVPGAFGGSGNTEFELLTGMSMFFMPSRSIPYKQYLKREIPSLPCFLRTRGYRTAAIYADPSTFYNRLEACRYLCFDEIAWLHADPTVARDATGVWPSDDALVDRIIDTAQEGTPFFVFAFPSSTHHPYSYTVYKDSDLDVLIDPGPVRDQVKYYINTLKVADQALSKLVRFFSERKEKTIIVVLGDHLPPLSESVLTRFFEGREKEEAQLAVFPKQYRVPLVIWSNYPRESKHVVLSSNALGPYLLGEMKMEPTGFLGFVNVLQEQLPVLSQYVQDVEGSRWSKKALPSRYDDLVRSYELLQYDLLFGDAYQLKVLPDR